MVQVSLLFEEVMISVCVIEVLLKLHFTDVSSSITFWNWAEIVISFSDGQMDGFMVVMVTAGRTVRLTIIVLSQYGYCCDGILRDRV